ncbi:conserved hypothetical protein [Ricinus communis]|uniref:Uncharacterized protein n=1 Tax=Ricinus communis TaxID=3988 RepID=B9SH85_RICCO|nr:conserved hypothetical protein [Ricinus communis]
MKALVDTISWFLTRDGYYTGGSGCHLAKKFIQAREYGDSGPDNYEQRVWKAMWKLHIPQKLDIFFGKLVTIIFLTIIDSAKGLLLEYQQMNNTTAILEALLVIHDRIHL